MAGWLAGDVDKWIYIDIDDQHEDSIRFIKDIENAIGKEVEILRSKQYRTVEECVLAFGGFRNPYNSFAPCTNWLKKRVRKQWEEEHQDYDLTYVWALILKKRTEPKEQLKQIRKRIMNFLLQKRIYQRKKFMDYLKEILISKDH